MNCNDFLSIVFIAIGLSADCFAVALSGGISGKQHTRLSIFRVALSFGLFQALMPVLGWLVGRTVVDYVSDYDHWVAFGLLVLVGGKMIWDAFNHVEEEKEVDISRGFLLITLSVATSIDALAVGLSFGFLDVNIALAGPTIGLVALVITVLGFVIGRKVGRLFGKRAEAIGGIILLVIACRILLEHILE